MESKEGVTSSIDAGEPVQIKKKHAKAVVATTLLLLLLITTISLSGGIKREMTGQETEYKQEQKLAEEMEQQRNEEVQKRMEETQKRSTPTQNATVMNPLKGPFTTIAEWMRWMWLPIALLITVQIFSSMWRRRW